MINSIFYSESNVVTTFKGVLIHYPIKRPTKVFSKVPYIIKSHDTIYSIASYWFKDGGEKYWDIICDLNGGLQFEDLIVGDVIYLPNVILNDVIEKVVNYEQNTSSTISV
jgi:hypothetical protein